MLPTIPVDVDPTMYYLCVGLGVLIIGIAKAGFGGGIGILAVPLIAVVMPVEQMIGLMLPVLILADILSNLHYLKEYEWRLMRWLLPGAIIGIVIGTALFWILNQSDSKTVVDDTLKLLVGSICLAVVLMQVFKLFGKEPPTLPKHPLSSVAIGTAAGIASTLSHAAGPIVSIYLVQEKVEKRKLMGTLLLFFMIMNLCKLPTYIGLGYINAQTLGNSIWFLPLLPIGTLAGAWMNKRVPEKPFAMIIYMTAFLAAAHMIYKVI
ncbi:MAG TPA: hypothetical protein DCM28_01410 [Phycisphaerales bacterium]|nr:hypothetical protein [Phycisphaerales bacterium]|tara:strand:+ start:5122 stop:5913 length:792 start_codon:yes stop_codon:yes gene_type:complete